jgi:hypothetical protein
MLSAPSLELPQYSLAAYTRMSSVKAVWFVGDAGKAMAIMRNLS